MNNNDRSSKVCFVDPSIMKEIIVDETKISKKFKDIKKFVASAQVLLTEEDIKDFLNSKLIEENPSLIGKNINENDIDISTNHFVESINLSKYEFDPSTLNYYRDYVKILKQKSMKLLSIIDELIKDKAGKLKWCTINNVIEQLDLKINKDKDICYEDLMRLVIPTIDNILKLKQILNEANCLDTYLEFSIKKVCESEDYTMYDIFPKKDLQIKQILDQDIPGYVPLSENQKNKIKKSNKIKSYLWSI